MREAALTRKLWVSGVSGRTRMPSLTAFTRCIHSGISTPCVSVGNWRASLDSAWAAAWTRAVSLIDRVGCPLGVVHRLLPAGGQSLRAGADVPASLGPPDHGRSGSGDVPGRLSRGGESSKASLGVMRPSSMLPGFSARCTTMEACGVAATALPTVLVEGMVAARFGCGVAWIPARPTLLTGSPALGSATRRCVSVRPGWGMCRCPGRMLRGDLASLCLT